MVEIPTTAATTMQALQAQLAGVDIGQVARDLVVITASLRQLVSGPQLRQTLDELAQATASLNRLTGSLERRVGPLADAAQGTLAGAQRVMGQAGSAVERVAAAASRAEALLAPDSPLLASVQRSADELTRTAAALRQAAADEATAMQSLQTLEQTMKDVFARRTLDARAGRGAGTPARCADPRPCRQPVMLPTPTMPRPTTLPPRNRRATAVSTKLRPAAALLPVLALLVACSSTPQPVQLYRLAAAPPASAVATAGAATGTPAAVWQLVPPVRLPEYLDRDAILVPTGQSGLQALAGHRWTEPLRESVPRLLRQDLATLLGESRVWGAPLPAGVVVTQQLRVEVLALEPAADRSAVTLQARWSVVDAPQAPPRVDRQVSSRAAAAGTIEDLGSPQHSLALWRRPSASRRGGGTLSPAWVWRCRRERRVAARRRPW